MDEDSCGSGSSPPGQRDHRECGAFLCGTLLRPLPVRWFAEILQYFSDDLRLRNIEADCIYAGIIIDTNQFYHPGPAWRTFEAAAFLRPQRCGYDQSTQDAQG